MKLIVFLFGLFAPIVCHSGSWDEVESMYSQYNLDTDRLNTLLSQHISTWNDLSAADKELASKGSIVSGLYESAKSSRALTSHASRVMSCMNSSRHGLTNNEFSTIMIGLMECSYKTE